MYDVGFPKSTEKALRKLKNKNPSTFEAVLSKIEEIQRDPYRYKNLKRPLQHLKRVHVDKSFVIIFSVDEVNKKVIIVKYAHHDIYELSALKSQENLIDLIHHSVANRIFSKPLRRKISCSVRSWLTVSF